MRSEKGDVLVLKPGEPIVELVDTCHYDKSTGSGDAEIVVTYVGENDDELSGFAFIRLTSKGIC